MTVLFFKRTFGSDFVQAGGFKNKSDLIQGSIQGKVIHFPQVQFHCICLFFATCIMLFLQEDVSIAFYIHKRGMPSGNYGNRPFAEGFATDFDIQFLFDILFQRYVYPLFFNETFPLFHCFRGTIFQYFQLVFRFSDQCSQRNRNGQTYHSCSRNAYAHRIFQDIGT